MDETQAQRDAHILLKAHRIRLDTDRFEAANASLRRGVNGELLNRTVDALCRATRKLALHETLGLIEDEAFEEVSLSDGSTYQACNADSVRTKILAMIAAVI